MQEVLQALKDTIEDLRWCSAASDFQPGGTAEKGYRIVRERCDQAARILHKHINPTDK